MTENLRRLEFPQLETGVFADYAGSFPLCQSQISRVQEFANDILASYPNETGRSKVDIEIETFAHELINYFKADDYNIYFSTNTSAAIHSLGFAFPWNANGAFIYHVDNHNSILGLRKVAQHFNSQIRACGSFPKQPVTAPTVFAYPAQSNFNGKKYPLSWISDFHEKSPQHAHVLIDCAAYCPTCELDLSSLKPDFIVLSLLKMFGAPGGLLLIRKDVFPILNNLTVPPPDKMDLISNAAAFKMRNLFISSLGMPVSKHVYNLARNLHSQLSELKHFNGNPLCKLYPETMESVEEHGGTITFNIFDYHGYPIEHEGIFIAASSENIYVRFGVHCNPGATYRALEWTPDGIREATKRHEAACSLTASVIDGRFVGSIRISLGYTSTQEDIDRLVNFFQSHFVTQDEPQIPPAEPSYQLAHAFIHPIKGCHGIEVTANHKINRSGLLYDEWWGVADEESRMLDRSRCPILAQLKLAIQDNNMIITRPDGDSITIVMNERPKGTKFTSSTACHERIGGDIYDSKVNEWFTQALGRHAILVRVEQEQMKPLRAFFTSSLSMVGAEDIKCLRPHLVFNSAVPFSEDSLVGKNLIKLGQLEFQGAGRIRITKEVMINGEEESGEPLRTISLLHSRAGVAELGILLDPLFVASRKNPKELEIGSFLV